MLISVAGPSERPASNARQFDLLNEAAAAISNLGHVPMVGVNAASPIVECLGPDADRYEAMMTISLALVDKCDAILILGSSPGADRERDLVSLRVCQFTERLTI